MGLKKRTIHVQHLGVNKHTDSSTIAAASMVQSRFTNLNCVVTRDPRNVEYFRDVLRDFLGHGIFNADGALWQRQRKTASIAFRSADFRRLTSSAVGDLVSSRLLPMLDSYAHSGVPFDLQVIEDEVFPDGTSLKKGTKLLYCAYAMGRMESIRGKDCREFKPERWIQVGQFTSQPAYKFPAFNGGPRLCLGKDFSCFQMKLIGANIMSQFHVQIVPEHPVLPKLALTMYMKQCLEVVLHKREAYK